MNASLTDDLARMVSAARAAIAAAADERALDDVRVRFLGKKGELTALLKTLGTLPADQRPAAGAEINTAKEQVQADLAERKAVLGAISHLEQADRRALHRLRVRLGPLDVFLPPLLKPAAQHIRAALLAVRFSTVPETLMQGALASFALYLTVYGLVVSAWRARRHHHVRPAAMPPSQAQPLPDMALEPPPTSFVRHRL